MFDPVFSLALLNTESIGDVREAFFPAAVGLKPLSTGRHALRMTSTRLPVKRFLFANTHFQARRLYPEQGASKIEKKVECET